MYRDNARARALGTRQNRYIDHLLYCAPLRRLVFVIALVIPASISVSLSVTAGWPDPMIPLSVRVFLGLLLVCIGMLLGVPTALSSHGHMKEKIRTRNTVLIIAYSPVAPLFLLAHWIGTGEWLPRSWRT